MDRERKKGPILKYRQPHKGLEDVSILDPPTKNIEREVDHILPQLGLDQELETVPLVTRQESPVKGRKMERRKVDFAQRAWMGRGLQK